MSNLVLPIIQTLLWIACLVLLAVCRVLYSPLAKFPGPRMAAITTWYQAYYDIWLGGQYFRKLNELHTKYGPIVRINPHELHVDDPEFIEVLFTGPGKRRDKDRWIGRAVQVPDSTVSTIPHELHRSRRAAFSPFFSKASIRRLEPAVTETLDNMLQRLETYSKTGEVVPLSTVYRAATNDIITGYCFGESTRFLLKDDYSGPYFNAASQFLRMTPWMTHIAWLSPLLNSIPSKVQAMLLPDLEPFFAMKRRWADQIEEVRSSQTLDGKTETVFHGMLSSDLSDTEKSTARLTQEAQLLVQAGQETTASTLASITFHLLADPSILKKLKQELATSFPDPDARPTAAQLERLPYLSAIIQEGLRCHPAVSGRMQRIAPDENLVYHDPSTKEYWVIPTGVSVSMDAISISMNPRIFPEPRRFLPERWIGNSRLDKYLLSFSKGTRMCAGINLAYAELYIILAGIFRKYDLYDAAAAQDTPTMELFETTRERDVDMEADFLAAWPSRESKGIRVVVR